MYNEGPRHGPAAHTPRRYNAMEKEYTCSECGATTMAEEKPATCPECGKAGTMEETTVPQTDVEGMEAD